MKRLVDVIESMEKLRKKELCFYPKAVREMQGATAKIQHKRKKFKERREAR
jgi:hypothetical protein